MSFTLQSDTFTAAGNGATINVSQRPFNKFSIVVTPTGAITSWTVVLESSLNGSNFTTVLTHTNVIGSNIIVFSGTLLSPSLYYRARCVAIVLGTGTNIISTILGTE